MVCNLREFKEFIDNEMIVILGQMDSPTEIFEHVYLVRTVWFKEEKKRPGTMLAGSHGLSSGSCSERQQCLS